MSKKYFWEVKTNIPFILINGIQKVDCFGSLFFKTKREACKHGRPVKIKNGLLKIIKAL